MKSFMKRSIRVFTYLVVASFFLGGLSLRLDGTTSAPSSLFENAMGLAAYKTLDLREEWVSMVYDLRLGREADGVFSAWSDIQKVYYGLGAESYPKRADCLLEDLYALDESSFLLIPIRTNPLIPDQTYLTIGMSDDKYILVEYGVCSIMSENELFSILSERLLNSYLVVVFPESEMRKTNCEFSSESGTTNELQNVKVIRISNKGNEYSLKNLSVQDRQGIFSFSVVGDLQKVFKVSGSCSCFLGYDQTDEDALNVYFNIPEMPKPDFELFVDVYHGENEDSLDKFRINFSGNVKSTHRFVVSPESMDISGSMDQLHQIFTIYDRKPSGSGITDVSFDGYDKDRLKISEVFEVYGENLRLPFHVVGSFRIQRMSDEAIQAEEFVTVFLSGDDFKEERVLHIKY